MNYDAERTKKEAVRNAWGGVFVAIIIAVVAGYAIVREGREIVPPPVNNTQTVEFELGEGCELRVAKPGESTDVYERPRRGDLIIGDVPHGTVLRFESVRVDWVQITAPEEGWISRRDVAEICP